MCDWIVQDGQQQQHLHHQQQPQQLPPSRAAAASIQGAATGRTRKGLSLQRSRESQVYGGGVGGVMCDAWRVVRDVWRVTWGVWRAACCG